MTQLNENKKSIVCEVQTFEEGSCLDIEASIDAGNIENEVRYNLSRETRFKAEVEVRLKAYEEAKAVEEGWKMEEEMILKKERCLVKEQMRHVQEEHKMSIKAEEQKCLQDLSAQDEMYEEETSVDLIKDKDGLNLVILSKERMDFDEDEIEEEKPKKLSRMTVAKLQQKVNLKASSNMVLIPQNWSFRRECSQDKSGIGKLAWKLTDFIKRDGTMKIRPSSRERENQKTGKRVRLKLRTYDNFSRYGKVRGETQPLDFKVVDPASVDGETERIPSEAGHSKMDICSPKWTFEYWTVWGDKNHPSEVGLECISFIFFLLL
ncbi:uncharacterized protein TNIN_198161 [Trichonephila inaurata madagascariensis]|uniref:DUF382 domain-containing protein n=1 Tax=Trichonephila inaurata madagascariensis TaxID=2747483 RepID=A0A8X6XQY3_9ARAC|nr:uncharacterized protein TNIN_198161 [Trichonephila inaurata madagascariensis]